MEVVGRLQLVLAVVGLYGSMPKSPGTEAENILVYPFQFGFNSRLMNMEKLAAMLVEHGHNVTFIVNSMIDTGRLHPHVGIIRYEVTLKSVTVSDDEFLQRFVKAKTMFNNLILFAKPQLEYCEHLLNSKVLYTLKGHTYDLLLIDYIEFCTRILVDYLDVPTILYNNWGYHSDEVFAPIFPSFVHMMTADYTEGMDFWERMQNFIDFIVWYGFYHYDTIPDMDRLKQLHNLNTSLTTADTFRKCAIVFANGNFAFDYPRPLMPRIVSIGGIFYESPKRLPESLETFMQQSGDRVVIVSFGSSNTQCIKQKAKIIAKALAAVPYQVIWSYGEPDSVETGSNTKVLKWIPQKDILGHPKTRVFVTHCGSSASHEAVLNAVPVVAIPLFWDQYGNSRKLVHRLGMGNLLPFLDFTTEDLVHGIIDTAMDSRYKTNAKRASVLMRDTPMDPKKTFIYWVDYVIRYKGAPHLQSEPLYDLTWYQFLLLDVFGFLILMLTCSIVLFLYLIKFSFRIYRILKKYKRE